jgi:23S rRNA (uracil1939-C5)-methyltransferase
MIIMNNQAKIEKLSHEGRGIARIEGKTTFIDGALPDETVVFEYTKKKSTYDEAKVVDVLEASPARVTPLCKHYAFCGGCSLQHMASEAQILIKQELFLDVLQRIAHIQPQTVLEPLSDEFWHYRHKARLSVKYLEKSNKLFMGFREAHNPRKIVALEECMILNSRVNELLVLLRDVIINLSQPGSIAQVEIAADANDVAFIIRNLLPLSVLDEELLYKFAMDHHVKLFLQPGKLDSIFLFAPNNASPWLHYELPDYNIKFKFHPTDFTQVNPGLNRKMVSLALELLDLNSDDVVLDLFCGLGNFSLPMATLCKKVVGIEGSETMVKRAADNSQENGLTNTEFLCANLDDCDLKSIFPNTKFNKILLDPPRSGALAIVQQIDRLNPEIIVYVSCNPTTLARDTEILVQQKGYKLQSAGVMNMFPHTTHVESIALFVKS